MSTGAATAAGPLMLDAAAETARIEAAIRRLVFHRLKRRGAVIGVSGGIDSTLVAYLCARALGPERVLLLFTPEDESSPESLLLGRMVAAALGAESRTEDIGPALRGARCYERRDEAVRLSLPQFGPGWKCKIVLPVLAEAEYAIFSVVAQAPDGGVHRARLSADASLGIVAATNFKQRTRKMVEYYWADRLQYAVAGTPNRLEYDLGFFVKNGDGAADFKPIAHLYKTQVFQLAAWLGVPEEIRSRPPTTDTYPLEQSQDEFYFMAPLEQMDLCLYGWNGGLAPATIAPAAGLDEQQARRMYRFIEGKRRVADYLHAAGLTVDTAE